MKEQLIILIIIVFITNNSFSDCSEELLTKNIISYIYVIERILNNEPIDDIDLKNDFFIIHEEWYESDKTKGQWYGDTLNIWFCMSNEKYLILLDYLVKRIFYIAKGYDWPDDYPNKKEINIINRIYFKIKYDIIVFMIRNDCWYYSIAGKLKKDDSGKYRIY